MLYTCECPLLQSKQLGHQVSRDKIKAKINQKAMGFPIVSSEIVPFKSIFNTLNSATLAYPCFSKKVPPKMS